MRKLRLGAPAHSAWHSLFVKLSQDLLSNLGFPGGSDNKESACNAGDSGSTLGQEEPLGKGMATHSSILAWRIPYLHVTNIMGSVGEVFSVACGWAATHSSIPAWRVLWTEEPGGVQFGGCEESDTTE